MLDTPIRLAAGLLLALLPAASAATEVPFASPASVASTAVRPDLADVDGDGDLDVIGRDTTVGGSVWWENLVGDGSSWSTPRTIAADGSTPRAGVDLDGDGDTDIVASNSNLLVWFENQNDIGTSWSTANTIPSVASDVNRLTVGDLDGDGHTDVVTSKGTRVDWYENENGDASSWVLRNVYTDSNSISTVKLADYDRDGDLDVASTSAASARISWHRNDGGAPLSWTLVNVDASATNVRNIDVGDIDRDGDADVAASFSVGDPVFYANDGSWTPTSITGAGAIQEIEVADADGDGDADLTLVNPTGNVLSWAENSNGAGTSWTVRSLPAFSQPNRMRGGDIDGDGDRDLIVESSFDVAFSWFENETLHRSATLGNLHAFASGQLGVKASVADDLDGDGDLDVLATSNDDDEVVWYPNDGTGDFASAVPQVISSTLDGALGVTSSDLDGDGDPDVLASSNVSHQLIWYANGGGGAFGPGTVIDTFTGGAWGVAAADLNRDGHADAVVAVLDEDGVYWYANDGAGGFGPRQTVGTSTDPRSVRAADLNEDGHLDVASAAGDALIWFAGDGLGGFGLPQVIVTSPASVASEVRIADMDGDGDLDVVGALFRDDQVAWYENDGAGTIATEHIIDLTLDGPWGLEIDDLDRDGDPDVLAISVTGAGLRTYSNDGAGGFGAGAVVDPNAPLSRWVATGDFDGDGDPDALVARETLDAVGWYENRGGQFRLATGDTAPAAVLQGAGRHVLSIQVTHNGRPADGDLELATLELRFEDGVGSALSSAQANALIDDLEIWVDDGSGFFEAGSDTLVTAVATLSLATGVQTVSFADGDPNLQVAQGTPRLYFVNLVLQANAASQTPNLFRVVHVTESSSSAEDRDNDIFLSLEFVANADSGVVQVWSPDTDNDGLADHEETALGTSTSLEDTDGDGLLDGEEVNEFGYGAVATDNSLSDFDSDGVTDVDELTVHGTSPFLADTDGDGVADNAEIGSTEPLDSTLPFVVHSIDTGLTASLAGLPLDVDRDGDMDLVVNENGGIVWYENANGVATSWTQRPLAASVQDDVVIGDFDGDGDEDVAGFDGIDALWYENSGSYGSVWSSTQIDEIAAGQAFLSAGDVDGDGDTDVVVSHSSNVLDWYANDGAGGGWAATPVATTTDTVQSLRLEDFDGDGDLDVVAATIAKTPTTEGPVLWYENLAGEGSQWAAREVTGTLSGSVYAGSGDLDGDGDSDAPFARPAAARFDWVENVYGDGSVGRIRSVSRVSGGVRLPFATDVDLDGDIDLLGDEASAGALVWFENTDGAGTLVKRRIATGLGGVFNGFPADMDGDGDVDFTTSDGGTLSWYENRTIHRSATLPGSVSLATSAYPEAIEAADLDGDGDRDLIVMAGTAGVVEWYENLAGDASSWNVAQTIDASAPHEDEVGVDRGGLLAADLDRDGDLDLLASSQGDDRTVWHENSAGDGSSWSEHLITNEVDDPVEVSAADLDGDGDLDVVVSSASDVSAEVRWHENDGASFTAFTTVVSGGVHRYEVEAADVDRDGDLDLVIADSFLDDVSWYENTAGDGSAWSAQPITSGTTNPTGLSLGDVDGDGDVDVVACGAGTPTRVEWYENRVPATWLVHNIGFDVSSCARTRVADLDGDGDPDVQATRAFLGGGGSGVVFFEHIPTGGLPLWTRHDATPIVRGLDGVLADLDGDGDPDVAMVAANSDQIAFLPNRGGQFALPTGARGYQGMVESRALDVLTIDYSHRGRSGDSDTLLTTIELRLEDDVAAPLSGAQADALFSEIRVYADDGSGAFEAGSDTSLGVVSAPFSPVAGVVDVATSDSLAPESTRLLFAVPTLSASASSAGTSQFQIVHLTESSSTAADGSAAVPLSLEFFADTGSGVIQALDPAGDADSDGLTNASEADTHGTDPLNPDSDGDTVSDGDEVNTHGSDPLDTDSDDDGLGDGAEVTLGTSLTNPDHDGDTVCDGGGTGGGACAAGPDNCPFIDNAPQTNGDVATAGDACQCGDVTDDGVLTALDATVMREVLLGVTPLSGAFNANRCDVTGTSDCGVDDIFAIERAAQGVSNLVGNSCPEYFSQP